MTFFAKGSRRSASFGVEAAPPNAVYVFRHAETPSNAGGIFMGSQDIASSADALVRARELSVSYCASLHVEHVYSSPLKRAKASAEALFGPGSPIVLDGRLAERSLGDWEGRQKREVQREFPGAFVSGAVLDPRFTPPGGEPLDLFTHRVRSFLVDLEDAALPGPTAIVTHNGVMRIMRHLIEGLQIDQAFAVAEGHLVPWQMVPDQQAWDTWRRGEGE